MMFRFEIADNIKIQPAIDKLQDKFQLGTDGYTDYDYAADLGQGDRSRFLGPESHSNKESRGDIAFTFLHAAAELFLDCLSGPVHGYYYREAETQSTYNFETPLEQYHHLFCNLTSTPTFAETCVDPDTGLSVLMTPSTRAQKQRADARWSAGTRVQLFY
jgi:hypothetical protein